MKMRTGKLYLILPRSGICEGMIRVSARSMKTYCVDINEVRLTLSRQNILKYLLKAKNLNEF